MNGTWWVGTGELDDDQNKIIVLPPDDNALIMGPPGSGKTNLLLLRANYLHLAGLTNIAIITFTRSLREFIALGAANYDFPPSKIVTCRSWQYDLLRQYGCTVDETGNFENDRTSFSSAIQRLCEEKNIQNIYDAILLDEAQDYTPEEIDIFYRLCRRLFCVADERQKIYQGDESIGRIKQYTGEPLLLRYHYRNGVNICKVADEIGRGWHNYQALKETANYDEAANPSTVDVIRCSSIEEQANEIAERLRTQRMAFPDQLLGVLCPKKDSMETVYGILSTNPIIGSDVGILHSRINNEFSEDKNIIVSTFHAAKGLEFRALHLAACEELKKFANNRYMAFTAVTRAKTALSVYHCDDIHSYLESALNSINPPPGLPNIEQVFGGSQ